MEENLKNKLGFWTFVFIIIFLVVGGYFFMKHTLEPKNKDKTETKEKVNYKIEKNKDYIYYENEKDIIAEAEVKTKDVVINLKGQNIITETLKKENELYQSKVEYISDKDIAIQEIINYNYDNIYALSFRNYLDYENGKYVSLVVNDYNYTCMDSVTFSKVKSYVFDTEKDELIKEEDLLKIYNVNMDQVKEKVRVYLQGKQSVVDGVEVIKIDDTLNDFSNYAFYINDFGKLCVTFLVKTTQVDYNEIMEVN